MVRLEEVQDEEFTRVQEGEKDFNDDDEFTDTDSEISEDESFVPFTTGETLTDRVIALKDILPPSARRRLTSGFESVKSYSWSGLKLAGKSAWILSTSVLLVGVPYVLALVDEQQVVEMEKEQRMREMGQELLTPGAPASGQQGRPAL